ncbi:unnamed protein product, partial [Oikopleura dioica]
LFQGNVSDEICGWRNQAGLSKMDYDCEATCGDNEVWTACADSCTDFRTCNNRFIPSNEYCPAGPTRLAGCICQDGFYRENGVCVPETECGCFIGDNNDEYVEFGYLYDECDQRCECLGNDNYVCRDWTEDELIAKGCIVDCRLEDNEKCYASGDPHYHTFDHCNFDFMGQCRYRLVAVDYESYDLDFNRVPFQVDVAMRRAWNDRPATMTEDVCIEIHVVDRPQGSGLPSQVSCEITDASGNVTTLGDRETWNHGGVEFSNFGSFAKVKTWFGVELIYNTQVWYVEVNVPNCLKEKTYGLCGNFNGECSDEYSFVYGTNITDNNDIDTWGNSHLTANYSVDGSCGPTIEVQPCDFDDASNADVVPFCDKLNDDTSIFALCHDYVNTEQIIGECQYDYCLDRSIGCDIYSAYISQCTYAMRAANVSTDALCNWRNEISECSVTCGVNEEWAGCADSCSDFYTCSEFRALVGDECSIPGEELQRCVCAPGHYRQVIDGVDVGCVPESECGCLTGEGDYVEIGYTFRDCNEDCICTTDGNYECTPLTEQELVEDGCIEYCFDEPKQKCYGSGDPHYHTFDGCNFDFMGQCRYRLVEVEYDHYDEYFKRVPFQVDVAMRRAWNDRTATMTEHVWFDFYLENDNVTETSDFHYTIEIETTVIDNYKTENNTIDLNDYEVWSEGGVVLQNFRSYAKVTTWFGVEVVYNTAVWYVEVNVPQCLQDRTIGLCGNFNGDGSCSEETAVLYGTNITDNTDLELWGSSHRTANFSVDGSCGPPAPVVPCLPDADVQAHCGQIADASTIFGQCHDLVPPTIIAQECEFDMCRSPEIGCGIYEAYFNQYISLFQGNVSDEICGWRNQAGLSKMDYDCEATCGDNEVWTACADSCTDFRTCNNRFVADNGYCPAGPSRLAGCICQDGFYRENGVCVPEAECGCFIGDNNDEYVEFGYLYDECDQRCECLGNDNYVCRDWTEDELIAKGCIVDCRLEDNEKCYASGDPHYHTFDHCNFDFMGQCRYRLVAVDYESYDLDFNRVPFQVDVAMRRACIEIHVVDRPQGSGLPSQVSCEITDASGNVTTLGDRETWNHGGVEFSNFGSFAKVKTWFGVELIYNTQVWYVEVNVPNCLKEKTYGLCGNFNGECSDEYSFVYGTNITDNNDIDTWGNSHLTANFSVDGSCGPTIEVQPCDFDDASNADVVPFCDKLNDETSIFGLCHDYVNTDQIIVECQYDYCLDRSIGCDIYSAYISQCTYAMRAANVSTDALCDWRNEISECSVTCGVNEEWAGCADSCSDFYTCSEFRSLVGDECPVPGEELQRCVCAPGHYRQVTDGVEGDCVPENECGCINEAGDYVPVGWNNAENGENCIDERYCECTGEGTL